MNFQGLTPEEIQSLQAAMLRDGQWTPPGPHVIDPDGDMSEPGGLVDGHEFVPTIKSAPVAPTEVLDLNTGAGYWRGRSFTIVERNLAIVRRLCVAAIEAALLTEISALRAEITIDDDTAPEFPGVS